MEGRGEEGGKGRRGREGENNNFTCSIAIVQNSSAVITYTIHSTVFVSE